MARVRVLITDDSVVYRAQIRAALAEFPWIDVVGTASNGKIALERLKHESADLLILDLEMPEMNGLETLKELRKIGTQVKSLVFSSASKQGAEITFEALRVGANDFVAKPSAGDGSPSAKIRALLEPKLRFLFPEQFAEGLRLPIETAHYPKIELRDFKPKLVVIASSTGGPAAIETLFLRITRPLLFPVVIAQHMPPVFTASLAERITRLTQIPCKEGEAGERLQSNCVYFAPGDFHMTLDGSIDRCQVLLDQGPLVNSVRPAADLLMSSAAKVFKSQCLGVVLTGMGHDGRDGARSIKDAGGAVLIQNRESCVVYGMPGAVEEAGAFDRIQSIEEIADFLVRASSGGSVYA